MYIHIIYIYIYIWLCLLCWCTQFGPNPWETRAGLPGPRPCLAWRRTAVGVRRAGRRVRGRAGLRFDGEGKKRGNWTIQLTWSLPHSKGEACWADAGKAPVGARWIDITKGGMAPFRNTGHDWLLNKSNIIQLKRKGHVRSNAAARGAKVNVPHGLC